MQNVFRNFQHMITDSHTHASLMQNASSNYNCRRGHKMQWEY